MSDPVDIEGAVIFEPDRRYQSQHGYFDVKVTHGVGEFWMTRRTANGLVRFLENNPAVAPATVTKAVRQWASLGSLERKHEGRE